MNINEFVRNQIKDSLETKQKLFQDAKLMEQIAKVCQVVIDAYKKGNKTLIGGNGGSAADAQHIAAEFVSRFYFDRPGLPSMALTTDTSILTAIGNDYGYDLLFARQIQANGNPGDVFIGISTSGKSPNVIKGIEMAKEKKLITVGFTGAKKGPMCSMVDYSIEVPSMDTPRIQECHILIGHTICAAVEEAIFGNK